MLSLVIFLPLVGMFAILALPAQAGFAIRAVALAFSGAVLLLLAAMWSAFVPDQGYQFVNAAPWIEALGVGYVVGADGISLPLLALTGLLFFLVLIFSVPEERWIKGYYAWFLFLETACLGVFAALDLFLFYVFWDLSLVGMYFIIALWGHDDAKAAALKFFLYTFVGSLALLLGIIGLYLGAEPHTMDMRALAEQPPLAPGGWLATLVFFALLLGFAIKIPVVPVHTWLPPAHTDAPAAGSAILAGILLKMGTYGLVRIVLPMLPETFQTYAWLVVVLGVTSVLYGALVALVQTDLKRMIAYTSVNHMGYVVMAIGAAAMLDRGDSASRVLALNGAVLQMVSHGLITGALFLLAGVLWRRAHTFEMDRFGGLAKVTPVFAAATGLAAFASLGLPGLSGFVAEFQIFVGAFGISPWAAVLALPGIVVTAALFLRALQRLFMGDLAERWAHTEDMAWYERLAIFPLLALVVLIGLLPFWILTVIDGATTALVTRLAP